MSLEQQVGQSPGVAKRHLISVSFFLALCLMVPLAQAGEESPERVAKRACLAGDYAQGVSILADLYVKTSNPVYIFNQARCFEQNGKYEEAIVRFREYQMKHQDSGHQSDPEAEKHIETCQALLDAQRQKESLVPAPVPESPTSSTIAPTASVTPPSTEPSSLGSDGSPTSPAPRVDVSQEPSRPPRSSLRIAGLASLGLGVAGFATGIILNVKANSLAREIDKDTQSEYPDLQSRQNTRASYETWGWVGYGVGGACLVGGAILTWLGYRQGGNGQVAFAPSVGSGGFGAAVRGAF